MDTTPKTDPPLSGRILEIQRMSTEDGPGLRTTVFFKGCPLKCSWCHNPESISRHPEIQWVGSRCIGCRTCIEVCPNDALSLHPNGMQIDRSRCTCCGICETECPSTAMEILGKTWELGQLVHEVVKDRVYFRKSDGGITVSGGEPTLQAAFTAAFLERIRAEGISTALDTCGLCLPQDLDGILAHTDLVLFDVKTMDAEKHRQLTGSGNQRILDNLLHTSHCMQRSGTPKALWIRTPVIPGATDSPADIRAIGSWLADHLASCAARWELCAFNNLCKDKYTRLARVWPFRETELLSKRHMEQLSETAKASGVDPEIVCWSGSTKQEDSAPDGAATSPELRLAAS